MELNIFDLLDNAFTLFNWAWTWRLPLNGFDIYPIQIGLFFLVICVIEDVIMPEIGDDEDDYD